MVGSYSVYLLVVASITIISQFSEPANIIENPFISRAVKTYKNGDIEEEWGLLTKLY